MSDKPRQIPQAQAGWRRAWGFVRRIAARSDAANIGLISAGVAFFGLFSIFPALAAIIAIFGLVADPVVVADQLSLLQDVIPEAAYAMFEGQISKLLLSGSRSLTWATVVSLVIALWSVRAGLAALVRGLNAAYGTRNRGGLRQQLVAFLLGTVLVLVSVVALLMVFGVPVVVAAVDPFVPVAGATAIVIEALRWAIAVVAMLFGLGLLYRYGPNRRGNRPRWVTPGALIVIAAWFAASLLFNLYLAEFARFNEVYGSISAVIIVQMWMFISAFLVMLGAVFNAELNSTLHNRADEAAVQQPVAD